MFGVRRRHEMPPDPSNPLNKQNIKDRVDGRNDPVAKKILERVALQQQEYEREKKQVCCCIFELRRRKRRRVTVAKRVRMTILSECIVYCTLFVAYRQRWLRTEGGKGAESRGESVDLGGELYSVLPFDRLYQILFRMIGFLTVVVLFINGGDV